MRTGSTQEVEVTYEWGKPERLHERGSAGAGYWSLERTRRYFGPKGQPKECHERRQAWVKGLFSAGIKSLQEVEKGGSGCCGVMVSEPKLLYQYSGCWPAMCGA